MLHGMTNAGNGLSLSDPCEINTFLFFLYILFSKQTGIRKFFLERMLFEEKFINMLDIEIYGKGKIMCI